jgi:O-antigen/teichoic acid export membrane protein
VGSLVGVIALGYYDRAYRTAQWPSTLLYALIARTGFYTYARLQDAPERLGRALRMMVWLIAVLALSVALAVVVAAPDLLLLLYGERWVPSAPYLRMLALVAGVRPLVDNANTLFTAVGKPWLAARLTGVQVAVLTVVGLPLVWQWGALGACLSVAAATGAGLFLVLRRLEGVAPGTAGELVTPALAALVALGGGLVIAGAPALADHGVLLRVVLEAGGAMALFAVALVVAQPRRARDRLAYVWRLAAVHRG